jgi:MFS family permease
VLRPYRDLLATPGAPAFSGSAFVARMPIAMLGLGIVLLLVAHDRSYGLAGAVSATLALVNALSAPRIARLVDRLGQSRVLLPSVAVHGVFLLTFVVLADADAGSWSLFLTAALAGVFAPSVGSLVRARWGHVLGPGPRLQTAYSFESVVDEVIFVVGPLLVAVLATRVRPPSGLLVALALLVVGSLGLTAHRASEPPPVPAHAHDGPTVLRTPGMAALITMMVFVGGVFGGVEISTVGFADQDGHRGLAGALLACYAGGSMVAGLAYGVVHWRVALPVRLVAGATAMTLTVASLSFVRSAGLLAPVLFVCGLGIAPTLISGLSLVERMVAPGQVTEGLTWATTGIVVGLSVASPIAGRIVDEVDARHAYLVALGSGLTAVLTGLLAARTLRAGLRSGGDRRATAER